MASRTAGIEVSIAAPRCTSDDLESFVSRAGDVDLRLFPAIGSAAFATSLPLIRWVRRSARLYDVVHVHGLFNPTSSLSARMALNSHAPTVLRPFGTLSKYTFAHRRTALKRAWFRFVERKNLTHAAALHFTTERERHDAEWHGVDFAGRAYVVPPPSLEVARPAEPSQSDPSEIRVLFLGRLNPVKNLESLLDAWRLVVVRLPDAVLDIAGDGDPSYVASLHDRALRAGVVDSVEFRGFVTGAYKQQLLSSASIVVLPSFHENFGVAALEAVQAGIPVVVSPEVHLADFIRRERLGVVAQSTPSDLADAIVRLIRDEETRTLVRRRGPELVAKNFSPEAVGELLSTMYRAAIDRSHHHASK